MKPSLVQVAMPIATGTVDFTDANISSDWKGAIFFGNDATANDTVAANAKFFIGATDGTRNVVYACGISDGPTAGPRSTQYISTTECIARMVASTSTVSCKAALSSTLTNGVRINYSATDTSGRIVNALQFAGSDLEFAVSSVTFSTSDTVKTVTTNLTGDYDSALIVSANSLASFGSTGAMRYTMGFHDGTNASGFGFEQTSLSNPTTLAAKITSDLGHSIVSLADHATFSITNRTATTFDLNRSASAGDAACVIVIAWRATSGTSAGKAFVAAAANSVASAAFVTGMAQKPQVMFTLPTRLVDTNLDTDDTVGSFGLCVAVNNNGSTQQMSAIAVSKDNTATPVAKCYVSNVAALHTADSSPAIVDKATVASWDSGGVTLATSVTVGSGVRNVAGLAYGIAAASAGAARGSMLGGFQELNGGFRG